MKLFLIQNKVDVIGILETRVNEHKARNILRKIAPNWACQCNYSMEYNGRI